MKKLLYECPKCRAIISENTIKKWWGSIAGKIGKTIPSKAHQAKMQAGRKKAKVK